MAVPDLLLGFDDPNTATGGQFAHGYLALPGAAGYYATAPDSAALSITGDIDIRFFGVLANWRAATTSRLVCKRNGTVNYDFHLVSGTPAFYQGSTATAATTNTLVNGTWGGLRVTRRFSDGLIKFLQSTDGITWTQIGTDVAGAAGALADTADALTIGIFGDLASTPLKGAVYRVQIRNNILDDGTGIVFDWDATKQPIGTVTCTEDSVNAATVTIAGPVAADTSGNLRDGRAINGVTFGAAGKRGMAATFDGVNDYVRVPDWSPGSTAVTIAAWIKPATVSSVQCIASKSTGGLSGGWQAYVSATGKFTSQARDTSVGATDCAGATTLTAGAWVHVAMTYDGTSLRSYVNGVLDAGPTPAAANTNTIDALIGAFNPTTPTSFFNGSIDELRVYPAALSQQQIQSVAQGQQSKFFMLNSRNRR